MAVDPKMAAKATLFFGLLAGCSSNTPEGYLQDQRIIFDSNTAEKIYYRNDGVEWIIPHQLIVYEGLRVEIYFDQDDLKFPTGFGESDVEDLVELTRVEYSQFPVADSDTQVTLLLLQNVDGETSVRVDAFNSDGTVNDFDDIVVALKQLAAQLKNEENALSFYIPNVGIVATNPHLTVNNSNTI